MARKEVQTTLTGRGSKCDPFFILAANALKGMKLTRRDDSGRAGYCILDFKNPKVKDQGYGDVGFKTMDDIWEGGAIAIDLNRNKVEGQIPMPHWAYGRREDFPFWEHCSKEETMIHGDVESDVSFAVFLSCDNSPSFWRSLREATRKILGAGHAEETGLEPLGH